MLNCKKSAGQRIQLPNTYSLHLHAALIILALIAVCLVVLYVTPSEPVSFIRGLAGTVFVFCTGLLASARAKIWQYQRDPDCID